MSQLTERGLNARLANADKLIVILKGFGDYAPPAGRETATLEQAAAAAKQTMKDMADSRYRYRVEVSDRSKMFFKDDASVSKRLAPILAHVRSVYGPEAKEYALVAGLVAKIRGQRRDTELPENAKEERLSQSQRSYGSIAGNFGELIQYLIAMDRRYAPANAMIDLDSLRTLHADCLRDSDAVTDSFVRFKEQIEKRNDQMEFLSELCQRIKDAVLSQYGTGSRQYKLVKGLNI